MSEITQTLGVRGGSRPRWRGWTVTAAVVATLGAGFAARSFSAPEGAAVDAARPLAQVGLAQDRPWIRPGSDRGTVKVQPIVDAIHRVAIHPGAHRGTVKQG